MKMNENAQQCLEINKTYMKTHENKQEGTSMFENQQICMKTH